MDEYEYDDADEFYDDNTNAYSRHNNHEVDDSEGTAFNTVKTMKENAPLNEIKSKFQYFHLDTEEASESEYGRGGRSNNEPLEIKEL